MELIKINKDNFLLVQKMSLKSVNNFEPKMFKWESTQVADCFSEEKENSISIFASKDAFWISLENKLTIS